MKIAFFGTSDRSVPILKSLKDNFELALCVTKEDKPIGRKQTLTETQVKKWAKENNVAYFTVSSLKKDFADELVGKLKTQGIELGIVADFSFMVPRKIIDTPKYGLINIHFSLLPKLRGASPVQHAILQGLDKTGITYYLLDQKMDTGDILKQVEYSLEGKETAGSLYNTLFNLAAEKLPQVINEYISGETTPQPQKDTQATYTWSPSHPKTTYLFKKDAEINWENSVEQIERAVRAYLPWPVAWTDLEKLQNNSKLTESFELKDNIDQNLRVKIYQAEIIDNKLKPTTLQVAGKNKADWESFLNGYRKNSKN